MKTIIVAAAMALTTLSASANTNSSKKITSFAVIESFRQEFGNISDVNWEPASNNMLRATFTKDGETVSAFFDASGQLLGSSSNIEPAALPAKVKAALANKVKEGAISEAIKYQDFDQQAYFIKIVSNNTQRLFRCSSEGDIKELKF